MADSTRVRISEAVWSAVAFVSMPSSFVPSVATSRPSTVPDTITFPVISTEWLKSKVSVDASHKIVASVVLLTAS